MILEIALGIVLAVVILSLLPLLIAAAGVLIVVGIGLAIVVAAVINWRVTLGVLGTVVIFGVAFGVPALLYERCTQRWPKLKLLIDGKPPYDTWRRAPQRLAVAIALVVILVSIGSGLAAAGTWVFNYVDKSLDQSVRDSQAAKN